MLIYCHTHRQVICMWLFAYCTKQACLTDHLLLISSSICLIHSLHDVLLIGPGVIAGDWQTGEVTFRRRWGWGVGTGRWISSEADKTEQSQMVELMVMWVLQGCVQCCRSGFPLGAKDLVCMHVLRFPAYFPSISCWLSPLSLLGVCVYFLPMYAEMSFCGVY